MPLAGWLRSSAAEECQLLLRTAREPLPVQRALIELTPQGEGPRQPCLPHTPRILRACVPQGRHETLGDTADSAKDAARQTTAVPSLDSGKSWICFSTSSTHAFPAAARTNVCNTVTSGGTTSKGSPSMGDRIRGNSCLIAPRPSSSPP